jgi:hypothetical protein
MSIKRLGRRTRCARVSLSPSKIPYGGFSPVRLQTERRVRPSSNWTYTHSKPCAFVLWPNGHEMPDAIAMAVRSRGPWLGCGLYCPTASSLTMASSAPLTAPSDLWISTEGLLPRKPAMRGSPIYSACVCHLAVFRTPTDQAVASGCCFTAHSSLALLRTGSASVSSAQSGTTRSCFEAAKFALCYGLMTC